MIKFLKEKVFTDYHIFEIVFPLCCFYIFQLSNQSITYKIFPIYFPPYLFLHIFAIMYVILFLWLKFSELIFKSMRKGSIFMLSVCSLISLVNYFALKNRSTCFVIYDLFSANTILNIFDFNMIKPDKFIIPMLLCIALAIFLIFGCKIKGAKITKLYKKIVVSICFTIASLLLLSGFIGEKTGIDGYRVHDGSMVFAYTYPMYFFNDIGQIAQHKVFVDSNVKKADSALSEYQCVENNIKNKAQNVIVVMCESYDDIRDEYGLVMNSNPYAYADVLKNMPNVKTGVITTSVFGGGTCDSECEFLTGVSTKYYPEQAGLYNIYLKDKHNTVFNQSFVDDGDTTVGMHLWKADGYRRDMLYDTVFCFDKSVFGNDYGYPKQYDTIQYARDLYGYEKIIEHYEQNKEFGKTSQFIFNVSTQAHMMYKYGFETEYVSADKNTQYTDWQIAQFNCYFNEIGDSITSFQTLIDYFTNVDENTIIVFFGDHQPTFDTLSVTDIPSEFDPYSTDYFVWANYDVDFSKIPDMVSLNYFGTNICDMAGFDLSPFQNYLMDLQSKYPNITRHFETNMSKEDNDTYKAICESYVFKYNSVKQYFEN